MENMNNETELNEEQLSSVAGGVYSRVDVENIVMQTIRNQLDCAPADMRSSSSIVEDLGADSLDVVDIVSSVDNRLGIHIPLEEYCNLRTVEDIVRIVERQLNRE